MAKKKQEQPSPLAPLPLGEGKKTPTAGIFILHYEDAEKTSRAVEAWSQFISETTFLTVIDNGSTIPYTHPMARLHRITQNIKVVDAWNAGMQASPADIYICTNNDAIPEPGLVEKFVEALEDENVGIVAAGTDDPSVGAMCVPYPNDLPNLDMKHVDGACWAWRHDFVEIVGWPDCKGHTHQMCWASNQDYCFRAGLYGYRVVCVRSAYVHHQRSLSYDRNEAYSAGVQWLIQKWGADIAPRVWA